MRLGKIQTIQKSDIQKENQSNIEQVSWFIIEVMEN